MKRIEKEKEILNGKQLWHNYVAQMFKDKYMFGHLSLTVRLNPRQIDWHNLCHFMRDIRNVPLTARLTVKGLREILLVSGRSLHPGCKVLRTVFLSVLGPKIQKPIISSRNGQEG